MKIFIKREQLVATVTDFYLDTIAEALRQCGHSVTSSYEWDGLQDCDMALVIACTRALKPWLARIPYIYWVQGIWPEESRMRKPSQIKYLVQSAIERFALKRAKYLFFVSKTMRRHYENKYRLGFEDRCYIMPCANEQLHGEVFHTPGKYENNVFCYAGGLSTWQCFEQTVALYARIEQQLPDAKLLLLVKDREQATQMLKKYGVKNYAIDYVPKEELPRVLSGVKFGFVLRQKSPVNAVATPTKIITYLASGVIPIYSDCLESVEEILAECGHRVKLSEENELQPILEMTQRQLSAGEVYKDFETICARHYNRQKHIDGIRHALQTKLR